MALKLHPDTARAIATGLAQGLRPVDAYQQVRPHVTRESAYALAALAQKDPLVIKFRAEIAARCEQAASLSREQIQQMLTLATITPKDSESLSRPENAWLLTADSESGTSRKLSAISAIDALRELSKISGFHIQTPTAPNTSAIRSLADCEDYAELLLQETQLVAARSGREKKAEEAICHGNAEVDSIFDTSWMD